MYNEVIIKYGVAIALGFLGWLIGVYESALQEFSISRLDDLIEVKKSSRSKILENIIADIQSFRLATAFTSTLFLGMFLVWCIFTFVLPGFTIPENIFSFSSLTVLLEILLVIIITSVLRGAGEVIGEVGAERIVYQLTFPVWMIIWPFKWPCKFIYATYRVFARGVGFEIEETQEDLEDKVIAAVTDGEIAGVVNEEQREMIERVFDFEHTDVADIFTPRTEMQSVEVTISIEEAIKVALESGHSRLPIHENTRDNVIGVFYVRDALQYWKKEEEPELRTIMRKPMFVPETKNVVELLQQMQKSHTQIVIVLDEYGGTAGLVTIEDVVEEIVGEIQDEYDTGDIDYFIKSFSRDHVVSDGHVHVTDINKALDEDIIPIDDDYETIGGFVLDNLGHIPNSGEEFMFMDLRVKIVAADERRVRRVEIFRQHSEIDETTGM